jgi:hypothetical protein
MALQPYVGPWPLFQFLNLIHSWYDSLDGGSARRKVAIYAQNNTNTEQMHIDTLPWVGLKPTIPAFEWAKTVHALGRTATVIGTFFYARGKITDTSWLHESTRKLA